MSRKTTAGLWLFLLLLLGVPLRAQTLEYWFDDNFEQRSSVSIATDADQELSLNLKSNTLFPMGFHKLNMRAIVGGKPTAVTSSDVLKIAAGTISKLEYWFDDDFDNLKTLPMTAATNGVAFQTIEDIDVSGLSTGFHQLHCRAASNSHFTTTAVTSTGIYKMPGGQITGLEYWLDDDIANAKTIEGKLASTGDAYIFSSNLDFKSTPPGFHKFNCRVVSTDKQLKGAVVSTPLYKAPLSNIAQLEYWLDNDSTNFKTLPMTAATDGQSWQFINNINLTAVSPGHHKIHFRAVSTDKKTVTQTTTAAVMVKSKYNVDNPEELTVVKQAFWVDNEEPEIRTVSNPKNVINQPYKVDTRKVSEGQHILHMQFQNSAGIWNAPFDTIFTKSKVVEPKIVAIQTVEKGVLKVNCNSIPFGEKYYLVRKYASGKLRQTDKVESTKYPASLRFSDTPAPGTYTYYVEGHYTDSDGEPQHVQSNEMSVTIENAAETVKKGTITGVLLTPTYSIADYQEQQNDWRQYPYSYSGDYRVYVNGEFLTSRGNGTFRIKDVAYGTELNIKVEDTEYSFNEVNIIVSEQNAGSTIFFKGRKLSASDEQPDNLAYDLAVIGDIHIVPNGLEVIVGNKSNFPWKGRIIAKVVRKKDKDSYDKKMSSDGSSWSWSDLWPWSNRVTDEIVYTTAVNSHLELSGWKTENLTLNIIDMPDKDKAEDYYVYLYSIKDNSDQVKDLDGYNGPRTLNFNPSNYTTGDQKTVVDYLTAFFETVKYLKKVEKWSDPFELITTSLEDVFDMLIIKYNNGQLNIRDDEVDTYINNLIDLSISSSGFMLTHFFKGLQKQIKKAKNFQLYDMVKNIDFIYNTIESFQQAQHADDNKKFFYTAKAVMSLSNKLLGKDPFYDIYKTYFDVGLAMVNAIEKFENSIHGYSLWERLLSGKGVFKIRVRKYTGNKDVKYFSANEFFKEPGSTKSHPGQIKSIEIKLKDVAAQCPDIHSTSYEYECNYNELVIKNVAYNNNNFTGIYDCEAWMIITWNNGRVMRVPLLNKYFVKTQNLNDKNEEPIFTIELQSETYQNVENIANNISYVKQ